MIMTNNPRGTKFDTKEDIINYVTKTLLPPPKEYFNELIEKVRIPDARDDDNLSKKIGKEVVIKDDVMTEEERKMMEQTLTTVYQNRVKNRNKLLIVGGQLILTSIILGVLFSRKRIKEFIPPLYYCPFENELKMLSSKIWLS